jgi:hypothetical protein
MEKCNLVHTDVETAASGLETSFVTKNQSATLMNILNVAMEDLGQVSGGLTLKTISVCMCVNCCS